MSKQSNIPQLRFKGFVEKWELKKLGDVAEKIGDGLHGTPIYSEDSDIYFINGNNLSNGKIEINENTKKVNKSTFEKNNKGLNENTLLISINGTIGNIAKYNNEKVMLGKSVGYYKFKENTDFYYHAFQTDKIQNFFISELTGSTIKNLSLKTLRETIISLPTIPEQEKIASFLSAVDEKIQQLTRKAALLEQYKKGVMQQLFSGKLRFKDDNGEEYADWEEKTFSDVGEIVTGKTPSTTDLNLWNGEIQFVTPTDINNGKYQFNTQRTIKEIASTRLLPSKSIMFTCIASIGKMCLSIKPCITNQQINSIVPYKDFDNEFIYYSILNIVDFIKSTQSTTTLPIINKTEFSKFKINVPISLAEQQKIAGFLSGIDEKIGVVNGELLKMQGFKKGLLQRMFI